MPSGPSLRPFPRNAVRIESGLLAERRRAMFQTGLAAQFRQIESTGRLENFERAARRESGGHKGRYYDDSDVYKWLEACAYALGSDPQLPIRSAYDRTLQAVVAAQLSDGYLNTFFQLNHADLRWRNLGAMHEMYCGGHLIEAGVAAFESLGERGLLDCATRFAEHIWERFGPNGKPGFCGHEVLEIALLRLSDAVNEPKYRELAELMIERRGTRPSIFEAELSDQEAQTLSPWMSRHLTRDGAYSGEYLQDHLPLARHQTVVGHAVRAMYLYTAAARFSKERRDWLDALQRCWENLVERRMYVTGGIGPSSQNEGFTTDFDLPNRTAYAETCAAVGLVFWGAEMLAATGNSEYADVVERALFNGALSGVSLAGDGYFYTNPLESRGEHARLPWFDCACCPPNIARALGRVADFLTSGARADRSAAPIVALHIPHPLEADLASIGVQGNLRVRTNYPWSGEVEIEFDLEAPAEIDLRIRIPGWCSDCRLDLGPGGTPADYDSGYARIRRTWSTGQTVKVDFAMPTVWVSADPRVLDDLGRCALMRGPIVYCLEEADFGRPPQTFIANTKAAIEGSFMSDLLEGVHTVRTHGLRVATEGPREGLYEPYEPHSKEPAVATMVPYFAWNNRGPGAMQVWHRVNAEP